MNLVLRLLTNPWLALAFRLYLGGIFIYAAMYKINYAGEFAATIASYNLAPWWSVNLLAVFMPWLELVSGFLLIIGFRSKTATVVIIALLALFTAAVTVNLLRGAPISCGCFHTIEDPISFATILRDLAWLAMAVHVYFFDTALQLENFVFRRLGAIEA